MKIGIVGMGWVGSSVAISTLHHGIASKLLLNDIRTDVAEGDALDLAQGVSFYPTAEVRAVELPDMLGADAIVIAAGRGGRPGETRLDLMKENAAIIESIGKQLRRFNGVVIVVTNPVDVMTYVMTRTSGLPPERVIGTGTMLDTARLRHMLGAALELDSRSIHAQVIGEHGDSSVTLWSGARIGGSRLREWPEWDQTKEDTITNAVRSAAYEIIRRKGATNHAIGLVTATLLRWMLRGEHRVVNVSRVQDGPFGLDDVALSLPAVVGRQGAIRIIEPKTSTEERAQLVQSANVLASAIASL